MFNQPLLTKALELSQELLQNQALDYSHKVNLLYLLHLKLAYGKMISGKHFLILH